MTKLSAFKGDEKLKDMLLEEIGKHRKADQIIQGTYGEGEGKNWKGCAVGCSIHSLNIRLKKDFRTSDHSVYETELEIPRALAKIEDGIFEGLSVEDSVMWPERFIKAITPGADLSLVVPQFMLFIVSDVKQFVKAEKYPEILKGIELIEALYKRKLAAEVIEDKEWIEARDKVRQARYADADADAAAAAAAAAADAAYAYAYAYAYAAAAYADAAAAAAAAAYAYAYAAAAYAYAADAAYAYARRKYYAKLADKLVELLESAK